MITLLTLSIAFHRNVMHNKDVKIFCSFLNHLFHLLSDGAEIFQGTLNTFSLFIIFLIYSVIFLSHFHVENKLFQGFSGVFSRSSSMIFMSFFLSAYFILHLIQACMFEIHALEILVFISPLAFFPTSSKKTARNCILSLTNYAFCSNMSRYFLAGQEIVYLVHT